MASECVETKDDPVVWKDHFYPEIVDLVTGAVLEDGQQGELVFTSLTKEALPIVRYRTRDLTRLLPPTAWAMRRIGKITGRSDNMLIIRGINVFPSQIEQLICGMPALAPHYLLVVDQDSHLDSFTVKVEIAATADDGNEAHRRLGEELRSLIKSLVGVSASVEVMPPFALERVSVGKAKRVLDRRPVV